MSDIVGPMLSDDFSEYAAGECFSDGQAFGNWVSVFSGLGCNSIVTVDGVNCLSLQPKASTASDETHSCLVAGPSYDADVQISCGVTNVAQLRAGSAPNAWEVGWVVWNYTDNDHFYYFIAKPNGWELGKRDPAYPGGQRFLQTGDLPVTAVGQRYSIQVSQSGSSLQVSVDGNAVASFTDAERPYAAGNIGFYCEDSHVLFDSVTVAGG